MDKPLMETLAFYGMSHLLDLQEPVCCICSSCRGEGQSTTDCTICPTCIIASMERAGIGRLRDPFLEVQE